MSFEAITATFLLLFGSFWCEMWTSMHKQRKGTPHIGRFASLARSMAWVRLRHLQGNSVQFRVFRHSEVHLESFWACRWQEGKLSYCIELSKDGSSKSVRVFHLNRLDCDWFTPNLDVHHSWHVYGHVGYYICSEFRLLWYPGQKNTSRPILPGREYCFTWSNNCSWSCLQVSQMKPQRKQLRPFLGVYAKSHFTRRTLP